MKKAILATISGLAITAAGVGLASARDQPANLGTARNGANVNLFDYSFVTGAVTASGIADWALGLVTDAAGPKQVTVSARATAVGAAVRVVTNDGLGTAFGATAFLAIPVSALYVNLTFTGINMPAGGVLFLDAIMNNGASINRVQFNP